MEDKTFLEDDFTFVSQDHEVILKDEVLPEKPFWKDILKRFCENKGAVIGGIFILLITILAIVVPMLSSWGFDDINTSIANHTPDSTNWFGTDNYGRDLFIRVWKGARISLFIAFAAMVIDVCIGIIYGLVSGYFGGKVDVIMQRIQEIINSIPTLVVLIILLTIMKASLFTIILALTFTEWIGMARITRAQVLKIKEKDFVMAAKASGTSKFKIVINHVWVQEVFLSSIKKFSPIFLDN